MMSTANNGSLITSVFSSLNSVGLPVLFFRRRDSANMLTRHALDRHHLITITDSNESLHYVKN